MEVDPCYRHNNPHCFWRSGWILQLAFQFIPKVFSRAEEAWKTLESLHPKLGKPSLYGVVFRQSLAGTEQGFHPDVV